jgi:FSR family fosmidomycin resistance protein-like MFS transporter
MAVETGNARSSKQSFGPPSASGAPAASFVVLASLSFCHLLNDVVSSLLPAVYPMLKQIFALSFGQIGLITAVYQLTASLLQPLIGLYTDRRPQTYALPLGMSCTLVGLLIFATTADFAVLLAATALVGVGSAVFHPESSRVARFASGGRHGFAQSLFQVGGNAGQALGPLAAAFIVLPRGQGSIAWFSAATLLAIVILTPIGRWYAPRRAAASARPGAARATATPLSHARIAGAIAVLLALIFSKYFYLASLTSYFTFYLVERFGIDVASAELHLFLFMAAVAAGTFIGGPVGDRIGRKSVIWVSIAGALPFSLLLPYADLFWTTILSMMAGLVISSAFSAIVVYAQELMPGRVGMVSGLFFGFAFGMGGIGAAVVGQLADLTSLDYAYRVCAFLPAIGLLTGLLPNIEARRKA